MRRLLIAALITCAATAWAEDVPPLSEIKYDTLVFKDGSTEAGTVVQKEADGSVVFTAAGRSGSVRYTKDQYDAIIPAQDASQAVLNRGRVLLARKDALGVKQCIRWGLEKEVSPAALTLALEALPVFPEDTDLGAIVLTQLVAQGRGAEREPIARTLLQRNPRFEAAYVALVEILGERGQQDEIAALTDRFLSVQPTSSRANQIKAELAEQTDLAGAQEAYRKLWSLHNDLDAALGYARCSLMLGQGENAEKAATALIQAGRAPGAANAVLGTAHAMQGRLDEARSALTLALTDGTLTEPFAGWARYNLGVVEYRLGHIAQARQRWENDDSPIGKLALAIVDKKPFTAESSLPASPALRGLVREHNACIALERAQADRAVAGLDVGGNARHLFLSQIADIVRTGGTGGGLQQLASANSVEALRWRAYGHILAKQWAEADAILAKLPEDDGYAAVYRIYSAAAQKNPVRAKELYKTLSMSANAPADYVAVLAAEYAASEDEVLLEDFDWVDGDQLSSGWQAEAIETNIRIHVREGTLVLEGTQSAAPEGVSRAWRMVAADRTSGISLKLDISGIATAKAGIEIGDEGRGKAVALAVLGDNRLGYRTRNGGAWSAWQDLPIRIQGTHPVLHLKLNAGRVFAVPGDNLSQQHALGEVQLPTQGFLAVGPFGTAEPGVAWRVAAEELQVHLKQQAKGRR